MNIPPPSMFTSSPMASSELRSAPPFSSNSAAGHSLTVDELYTATFGKPPRPMEPCGVPGSRVMMIASSVEPKPSQTVQPKRRENSSMSRSVASLPKATRRGLSRRRASPRWRGCRRAACRRSSCTSPCSAGCPRGRSTRRTSPGRSRRHRTVRHSTRPSVRHCGKVASRGSRRRRARCRTCPRGPVRRTGSSSARTEQAWGGCRWCPR